MKTQHLIIAIPAAFALWAGSTVEDRSPKMASLVGAASLTPVRAAQLELITATTSTAHKIMDESAGTLRGRVLLADGQIVSFAQIKVLQGDVPAGEVITSPDGRFEIAAPTHARLTLWIDHPGGTGRAIDFTMDDTSDVGDIILDVAQLHI